MKRRGLEQRKGRGFVPRPLLLALIHQSAWKVNSAIFAITEFLDVRLKKNCPPGISIAFCQPARVPASQVERCGFARPPPPTAKAEAR